MLSNKQFQFGQISGVVYDFLESGDILERHSHDENTAHISIIARGSFEVRGDGWKRDALLGQIIDFPAGQFHEFEALEPGSRLVNVIKTAKAG